MRQCPTHQLLIDAGTAVVARPSISLSGERLIMASISSRAQRSSAATKAARDFKTIEVAGPISDHARCVRPPWNRVIFLHETARRDGRGVYRAKSRNVSETRARMRFRSRIRPLPPPAPGFHLSSRGAGVPDQAATRSGTGAAQDRPPCGKSEPGSRAKHALRPQAHPASRDALELSTWL